MGFLSPTILTFLVLCLSPLPSVKAQERKKLEILSIRLPTDRVTQPGQSESYHWLSNNFFTEDNEVIQNVDLIAGTNETTNNNVVQALSAYF